jgi:aryl-alcohol dehydrogenase-like predicted oxidoreductase
MSALALGCYPLGGGYGSVDERQARATVDAALDAGWTFLDTAETYLESEERLGRILSGRRDRVFLATKAFPFEPYTYENLSTAIESSLRRLQTDHVDLFQLHGPEDWVRPLDPTPVDEVADALDRLRTSGKAVRVGVCNFGVEQLEALAARTSVFSTQNLYSLIDRGDHDEPELPAVDLLLAYARDHDIGFLAYSPLSRGLLGNRLDRSRRFPPDDERHYLPRYQPGVFEYFAELNLRLGEWARDRGRTLAQLAIAWTLQHPAVVSTLVGAKSPEQVNDLAGADEWRLSAAELAELSAIVETLPVGAKEAPVTVWEHLTDERLDVLRARRHRRNE